MKKLLLLILQISLVSNLLAQTDSDQLAVGLKDGSLLSPQSIRLRSPMFGKQYLFINDSLKVDLNTVRYYQDVTGYYQNEALKNSNKEQLFKRDYKGEISVFSQVKTNYVPSYTPGGYMGGSFITSEIFYLKKGSGDMESFNYANVSKAVAGNEQSLRKIASVKTIRAIELTSYLATAGLFIAGISHTKSLNKETGPPPYADTSIKISPLLIGAAATITVPLLTKRVKKRKLLEAITIYNAG